MNRTSGLTLRIILLALIPEPYPGEHRSAEMEVIGIGAMADLSHSAHAG